MEYLGNLFEWARDRVLEWQGFDDDWPYTASPAQSEGHGSQSEDNDNQEAQSGDEDMLDEEHLQEFRAGNVSNGTNMATTGGGKRREVHSGGVASGFLSRNGQRQGNPVSPGNNRGSRTPPPPPPPPVTTQRLDEEDDELPPLSAHYFERHDQALKAHEATMKRRREEERHDRDFSKRRRYGIFRNQRNAWHTEGTAEFPPAPPVTIEREDYEFYRVWKDEARRNGRRSAQPGHRSPRTVNVGGDSRVEQLRKQRQELLELAKKAQQNSQQTPSPPKQPTGDNNNRGRPSSPPGQGPTSPRSGSKAASPQQGPSTPGGWSNVPQTPPKSNTPQQPPPKTSLESTTPPGSPPKRNATPPKEPSPKKKRKPIDDLRIDGTEKLGFGNATQTGGDADPEAGKGKGRKTSPPRETGPGQPPSRPRRPRRTGRKLEVEVDFISEDGILACESQGFGPEITEGEDLQCLCYAIRASIEAQHPGDDIPDMAECQRTMVRGLPKDVRDEFLEPYKDSRFDARSGGRNFTGEEAFRGISMLGYQLLLVVEASSRPQAYVRDQGPDQDFPPTKGYLVLHWSDRVYYKGHFSSIGPKTTRPLRVGKTRPLSPGTQAARGLINAGKRGETPDKTSPSGEKQSAKSATTSITPERQALFRDGLSELVHQSRFTNGVTLNVVAAAVNWNLRWRPDRASSTHVNFTGDEAQTILTALSGANDLVEYPVRGDHGRVRQHRDLPEQCLGSECPCDSQISKGKLPPQSRKGESSSQSQGRRNSPPASTQPQTQLSVGRLATYRGALAKIMDHLEHADKYYNTGVKDARVLVRINAHLRRQTVAGSEAAPVYDEDESKTCLTALAEQGDMIRYPVNGDLVQRIRPGEPRSPRRKDNTIKADNIGGALAGTFGPKAMGTKPASSKGEGKSPPPETRSNQETTGRKRKSADAPAAAANANKKQNSGPPPSKSQGTTKKKGVWGGGLAKKLEKQPFQ
ncbi:hypothetical protein CLAFUW4_07405 [Fulvia fulva]|uniref:Uncharacterized protein n=1 Tax=Passalora fulva TaxID=5499 RepID=A0A9Q8P9X3_PASFU|nr:uncharacterized protein CLAFUR5_07535 [Fulvia fulva]KAK4621503.1 hypothetical protein CLAFUR4_07412 [Fulvia fulva]KAK4623481.1 hypothetical protein CLAFUR0_07411 [Fulvia fulva]UJO18584.1 hypothetical protein CLAFUR5_07535 [Fulvia fulva]WPV16623.1 hypothetical protein CLAFUW4_07405 [Fulvia fulva]WPV31129.1 hypothetical protein CLAFUW7_07408 [Fulvia fulva]